MAVVRMWDGTKYVDVAGIAGPQGQTGPPGPTGSMPRYEAKISPGTAAVETVSWTAAFAAAPVVSVTVFHATTNCGVTLNSVSTTSAAAKTWVPGASGSSVDSARVKHFIAMGAT